MLTSARVRKCLPPHGLRGPGESYSDVILRLVEIEVHGEL
jgi:hypothetical protein